MYIELLTFRMLPLCLQPDLIFCFVLAFEFTLCIPYANRTWTLLLVDMAASPATVEAATQLPMKRLVVCCDGMSYFLFAAVWHFSAVLTSRMLG